MTSHLTDIPRDDPPGASRPRRPWRALGAGAGLVGTEGVAGYLHPALGEALAAADVIVPLAITLILLTAILCGSKETVERVFRLLRWTANRPEPPSPGQEPAASPRTTSSGHTRTRRQ